MFNYLRNLLRYEPAVIAWAANGGLALVLAYAFHITRTQEAAVTTITTALASVFTAWKAGPSNAPVILGALTTAVTAAGAFGFHPSAQLLATLAAAGSAVLPWIMRANLTPKATPAVPPHEPEHAAPAVVQARLTDEHMNELASHVATRVGAIVKPARKPRSM